MTSTHDLLEAYDRQLRREGEVGQATELVELGPLMLATFDHGGFVTYRSLEGHDVDTLISGAIVHFRDRTDVASFEWKTRGHDWPDDLGERLAAHALVAEPVETVMIGEASALAVPVEVPGVTIRRAGETGDVRRDVEAMLAMQESVFGRGRGPSVESALATLESGEAEMWLAEVDGTVVCAGRLQVVPGTRVRRDLGRRDAAGVPRPRDLPGPGLGPRPLGGGPRGPLPPLRLDRHVAPDPGALRAGARDDHDAVRLDPLKAPSGGSP